MKKDKVLVAMSGGIDSSMAALILQEQGYDLVGITMKTWDYSCTGASGKETGCCNLDTINDARAVAVRMGFPHYILDLQEEFTNSIVRNFIDEYMAGFTPNPCVLCNALIKWKALLLKADVLGCRYIATGHYAQVRFENERYILSKGSDNLKDQSYVLWQLTQENLSRTIFPLGHLPKSDIRKMAADNGFENLAAKRESYEICFIPDDDYRKFLTHQVPDINERIGEGPFVDIQGKVIGTHKGFPFYTIGQRKGLNVAVGHPLYVKEILSESNTIVLATAEALLNNSMIVSDVNLINTTAIPQEGITALVKIRYKDPGTLAKLVPVDDNTLCVNFQKGVSAITPGQSAVFYIDNDVLGGGIIKKVSSL